MASLGTNRLNIVNDQPSVEKLWNGRYRLEFYCDNDGKKTDWYYTNVGNILPDFGTLQGDGFGENPSESIPASKYADMRLIEVGTEYVPAANQHYVKLTYETLTAAWVLEKDEDTDYELNGLKRITRTSVALPDTAYTNVIGTSTITSDATTLYLGSYKIEETDAKWMLTEVWLEAGTLSETTDFVGSQQSRVIETIGADPATPSGYSLASKQESNFEGFQTNRFTFLKPSVLSRSIDTRNNGKLIIETVEAFNEVPTADTAGAVQIGNDVSDVEGIPTRRYTFALGEGQIRVSTRPGPVALAGTREVTVVSYGTKVTRTGAVIAESEVEEDGYISYSVTALQGTIEGIKQTYKDVIDVEVPGTVSCTTVPVSSGEVSGGLAVPRVTPRRSKKIAATVEVEITTTPPSTASLAFDLGAISCSVTTTNVSLSRGPGSTVTIGTNAIVSDTGFVQNFGASANIGVYPGCYLTSAGSSGTVAYITSSQPVANGNIISRSESASSRDTTCTGTGSSAATGYVEIGIIKRNSRPILTTIEGVTYYEVITWSV
jgi:hypothetical protein